MSTFGERCAADVREYLKRYNLKTSQLTGKIVGELIDHRMKFEAQLAAKKKKLATEEDWIKELESEPAIAGVNVRLELAQAQFWCKNNRRQCTRPFFVNWLNKAKQRLVISPGGEGPAGAAGGAGKPKSPQSGPAGWLEKLRELFPNSTLTTPGGTFEIAHETDYEWRKLDASIRLKLINALLPEIGSKE